MAGYQNTLVNSFNELYGSGQVFVAPYSANPDIATAINVGAASGIEADEGLKFSSLEDDNTEGRDYISDVQPTVKFQISEVLARRIWAALRSTIDKVESVVGTARVGEPQTIKAGSAVKGKTIIGLAFQNADGSKHAITTVMQGATALVSGTDYVQAFSNGVWGIMFTESGAYDATKDTVVTYNVTPAASINTFSGHASELPFCHVWIVTKHAVQPFSVLFYKCTLKSGKKFSWKKDNDGDPRMKIEIELSGKHDDFHVNAETGNGYVYKTSQGEAA